MKSLIFMIVVVVAAIFVFGLYMGWFFVSSTNVDGQSNITLTVDKEKIQQDKEKAVATVTDLGQQTNEDQTVDPKQDAQEQPASDEQPSPPGHE